MREPPLDPESPGVVEVPDVARAMPLHPVLVDGPGAIVRRPEPVVAERQPRRADDDLAARAVAARQRLDPETDACERQPDADPATRPDARERLEVDVGHREHLGHAVGRVQLGRGSEEAERLERALRHGCAGREDETERGERLPPLRR